MGHRRRREKRETLGDRANLFHSIGYRDALANLITEARLTSSSHAVYSAALQLLELDPTHPHAKWVLENEIQNRQP